MSVRKHRSWSEVNRETSRAWLFRTDSERLAAVTLLAEYHHNYEPKPMHEHFLRFIQLLNEEEAEYVVIGGFAVDKHGHPRYRFKMWKPSSNMFAS